MQQGENFVEQEGGPNKSFENRQDDWPKARNLLNVVNGDADHREKINSPAHETMVVTMPFFRRATLLFFVYLFFFCHFFLSLQVLCSLTGSKTRKSTKVKSTMPALLRKAMQAGLQIPAIRILQEIERRWTLFIYLYYNTFLF